MLFGFDIGIQTELLDDTHLIKLVLLRNKLNFKRHITLMSSGIKIRPVCLLGKPAISVVEANRPEHPAFKQWEDAFAMARERKKIIGEAESKEAGH